MKPQDNKLIEVKNLRTYFPVKRQAFWEKSGHVKAVDDISFHIEKGETFGLVGESGCGKSTLGRTLTRLYKPSSGEVFFDGQPIGALDEKKLKPYRKRMQMIFQNPFESLNPSMTVEELIGEPMGIHGTANGQERKAMIIDLLEKVGLGEEHLQRYPHEFSGGQRQRIGIARALSVKPEFILCDEPLSALDVSIQAQVVNMLEELQEEFGLTYLFIAHDLAMVRHISDRIGVMYLGKMVEISESDELYENPLHPYTKALLSAIPIVDPDGKAAEERIILTGDVPSPMNPPSGCRFRTRCQYRMAKCSEEEPQLRVVSGGHSVACHLYGE